MMLTKKKSAFSLVVFAGLIFFVSGVYLTFFWMNGRRIGRGDYSVEGGDLLQLSWYLEKGDRTEGGFTVSGGNEVVRFYIENPSGKYIYAPKNVKTQFLNGFTAGQEGVHRFYFDNQEYPNEKIIHANFRSPYEPSINRFQILGLSMMLGGLIILVSGIRGLIVKERT